MGEAGEQLEVTPVAEDLSEPTDVAELPDGRLVVTERLGDVVVIAADGTPTTAGHITVDPDFGEQGLLGVVADPGFATNNFLYFYASVGNDLPQKNRVYKITLGTDNMLDSGRDAIVTGLLASSFGNHNGGGLQIYDNHLFVSVGDSGNNASPPTNKLGTCLNSPNGKILRVNLDGSIPDDNPLSGEAMVTGCPSYNGDLGNQAPDKRIFNWGFRNPYRFWIDPETTRMWIGDVGEQTREEVSVGAPLSGEGANGQHFGWPFNEGTTEWTQSWRPSNDCQGVTPGRDCVAPVFDYETTRGGDACVIGGLIPHGCGWAAPWTSRYFFGDNSGGKMWTLEVNANRDGVMANSRVQVASTSGVGSFRMGANGALYVVEVRGGVVSRITPRDLDPTMCEGSGGTGGTSAGGNAGTGNAGDAGSGMQAGAGMGGAGGAMAGSGPVAGGGSGPMTGGTGGSGPMTGGSGPMTGGTGGMGTGGMGTGGMGTGGMSSGGAGTNASGGAPAGMGGAAGGSEPKEEGGCGCRVAGGGGRLGGLLAVSAGLALLALRRARKRGRESLH